MATETIGKHQLHLVAYELPNGRWDPFLSVYRFDEEAEDFRCVIEKYHASEVPLESYEAAIEEARRVGNQLILGKKL